MSVVVKIITSCRACDGGLGPVVFEMAPMPLAGAFALTREEAITSQRFPLSWRQCSNCQLVQVIEDIPDNLLYKKYCYASSSVRALVEHFDQYAGFLVRRYGSEKLHLLEIGCNDGVLLRQLPVTWDRVGVDPSDVALASDRSYQLINEPFGTALELEGFDVVTASNCLAHVSDIGEILEGVQQALVPGGEFWVEVHDLEATLASGQWDTVYHEHKAEYSLESLTRAVVPFGFTVVHVDRLPLHGGLLRVGFRKIAAGDPVVGSPLEFDGLNKAYASRRQTQVYGAVKEALDCGGRVIAYGAAGRATVWFNQLPELQFTAVADDSPLRMGRFIPGVGHSILPWRECGPSSFCLITAWNYSEAIRAAHPEYRGMWGQTFSAVQLLNKQEILQL